jgi:2-dehydro-3-deoxyphosphogluconate aldolase / (4S)-4-hydroxy-2-oxoglutarate aldolase
VTRPAVPAGITGPGVLAIARRLDAATVPSIADALREGGIRALELTLNEPEAVALEAIEAAARHLAGSDVVVGAGTVLSVDAARRAVDAGAAFLVSPHLDEGVVAWAAEAGIPALPGAATPTEVLLGWRAGAAAIKVFPASSLGPTFLRELRGPLPDIPLVPTGGVTVENAGGFIEAGAIAIGLGSWLFADRSPGSIRERAEQALGAVAAARASG